MLDAACSVCRHVDGLIGRICRYVENLDLMSDKPGSHRIQLLDAQVDQNVSR
jgi:hypothetical protein